MASLSQNKEVVPDKRRALPLTLSWYEIAEWQRDNEYIMTGYRR
jgi:adiponectin receptor